MSKSAVTRQVEEVAAAQIFTRFSKTPTLDHPTLQASNRVTRLPTLAGAKLHETSLWPVFRWSDWVNLFRPGFIGLKILSAVAEWGWTETVAVQLAWLECLVLLLLVRLTQTYTSIHIQVCLYPITRMLPDLGDAKGVLYLSLFQAFTVA